MLSSIRSYVYSTLNDAILISQSSFSFLGITINENLSWPSYITTLVGKDSKEKALLPKEI